eukprot:TRINITY_DN51385_c0_g1_i1.p1 TRINITY_DN51385_c0_g1~~TRINITY_DN51385_c0_g1_i1.p1  ORF type:complete len:648 (-),score=113.84 TRINITY_DN51385_c0_g1_i1:34-1977(-)
MQPNQVSAGRFNEQYHSLGRHSSVLSVFQEDCQTPPAATIDAGNLQRGGAASYSAPGSAVGSRSSSYGPQPRAVNDSFASTSFMSTPPSEWSGNTKMCTNCGARFGLLRRPHHCRKCGRCVCHACSPNRILLDGPKGPQRVCTPCLRALPLPGGLPSVSCPTISTGVPTFADANGKQPTLPIVSPKSRGLQTDSHKAGSPFAAALSTGEAGHTFAAAASTGEAGNPFAAAASIGEAGNPFGAAASIAEEPTGVTSKVPRVPEDGFDEDDVVAPSLSRRSSKAQKGPEIMSIESEDNMSRGSAGPQRFRMGTVDSQSSFPGLQGIEGVADVTNRPSDAFWKNASGRWDGAKIEEETVEGSVDELRDKVNKKTLDLKAAQAEVMRVHEFLLNYADRIESASGKQVNVVSFSMSPRKRGPGDSPGTTMSTDVEQAFAQCEASFAPITEAMQRVEVLQKTVAEKEEEAAAALRQAHAAEEQLQRLQDTERQTAEVLSQHASQIRAAAAAAGLAKEDASPGTAPGSMKEALELCTAAMAALKDAGLVAVEEAREAEPGQTSNLDQESNFTTPGSWEENVANCSVCDSKFSKRALRRRHHCRVCGKCVCSNCSPSTLQIKDVGLVRTCNLCVNSAFAGRVTASVATASVDSSA